MKILHVTTHLNIGGIGKYVTDLTLALKKNGHEVFVASSGGDLEYKLKEKGIPHIYLDIKTKSELSPKVFKTSVNLKKVIKEKNIEIVHAHTRVSQVSTAIACRFAKVPYVTTCHGFFKKRLGRTLFGAWGSRAIAISQAVYNHLVADFHLDKKKVALVYTGIDTEHFENELSKENKESLRIKYGIKKARIVGNIGRLSPVKGQKALIKAAELVLKEFNDVNVLLVGDGPDEKYLKKLALSLNVDKNIIFVKSVKDTKEALSLMDIFVLPSIKEGLGLSLLEAMASSKPCIASKIGGIENIIEDGKDGILVKPEDPLLLSQAIVRLLKDNTLRNNLGAKAREKAFSGFTIKRMVKNIEDLYKEVLMESRG